MSESFRPLNTMLSAASNNLRLSGDVDEVFTSLLS